MAIVTTLLTAVGLGLGAGLNAYATLVVVSLVARFAPGVLPGDLARFFASTPILIAAVVLYAIEFVADKIPAVDHVWDVVHTFIRPLAGAAVALATVSPAMPRGVVILASVLAGGAALGSHLTKSATRVASTATTGGVGNPILSLGEDVLAFAGAGLSIFLPVVVAGVVGIIVLVAGFAWISRRERAGVRSKIERGRAL
jgi:hypothetical protein